MRVLFNATAAFPGTSGEVHTVGLLRALSGLSPRHEFVLLTTPDQEFLRAQLPKVESHVAESLHGGGLARTIRLHTSLARIQRATHADIVYNKGNFFAPFAGRQITFIENSNPYSTIGLPPPSKKYVRRMRLLRWMSDRALRQAAAVIFPTDRARKLITARSRVRAKQAVIPYGCDVARHQSIDPSDPPFLLLVSSVLPYKNVETALHAVAILKRYKLKIVGADVTQRVGAEAYLSKVQRLIEELGLTDRVESHAALPVEELNKHYATAACLVMPSLEETFGIPLIEAMAHDCPVVAAKPPSDAYFMPYKDICESAAEYFELVFKAGGALKEEDSGDNCAKAIEQAMQPERRREMIADGRTRAAVYSWRAAAEKTLELLDTLA